MLQVRRLSDELMDHEGVDEETRSMAERSAGGKKGEGEVEGFFAVSVQDKTEEIAVGEHDIDHEEGRPEARLSTMTRTAAGMMKLTAVLGAELKSMPPAKIHKSTNTLIHFQ